MRRSRLVVVLVLFFVTVTVLGPAAATPSRAGPSPVIRSSSSGLPELTRQGLALPMGPAGSADEEQVGYPSVLVDRGVFKMWYFEVQPTPWLAQIAYATSPDGYRWTKHGAVLSPTLPLEYNDVAYPTVDLVDGTYWMWYDGWDGAIYRIFAATSADGVSWTKHGVVLDVGPAGSQDSASVAYPFVLYDQGRFYLWYTGLTSFSPPDNSAIMLATSSDGLQWTKQGTVLAPGAAGSLDSYNTFTAGVVRDGATWVMVYTGQDANATSQLLWAQSSDGATWQKSGVALAPDPPAERSVGGADPLITSDGTWMVYYGVRNYTSDIQIYLATSGGGPHGAPEGPSAEFSAVASALTGWAPPFLVVATFTGVGALGGAGLCLAGSRFRRRTT